MEQLATGYGLIEGPVWDDQRGLLFSDVTFGGVFAVTGQGAVSTVFEHRRGIGGMTQHVSGQGLVVSGRNIAFKPFDDGPTVEILGQPDTNGGVGFNDITADNHGRIYAGELGESPFADAPTGRAGRLWCIEPDGAARVVAEDVLLTNGLAFSPDDRVLYHSDSRRNAVMAYDVFEDGSLGPKREWATTTDGAPDGLVVSEDGAVWVALAGGSGVAVFGADGKEKRRITIPAPMCTSVCFGGPDLRQLYIVSGSEGAGTDRGGAVWVIDTEVAGLPVAPATTVLA